MRAHRRGGPDNVLVRRICVAVADVLADCAREEVRLLWDDGHLLREGVEGHVAYVHAVQQHPALFHVVEAHKERDYGRLARARGPDQGDRIARRDVQVHAIQDGLVLHVVEADALEPHVAADGIDTRAAGPVNHVGLHVHQLEYARAGGHGALQGAVLHGEVQDRLEEALDVEGEGDQHADLQRAVQH